jgi:hypothetical protein
LQNGSLTKIEFPSRRYGAIDLTLCSADIALNDILWLDDADGSDHLSILTFLQSFNVPTNIPVPILDLTRHIAWSVWNWSSSHCKILRQDLISRSDTTSLWISFESQQNVSPLLP